MARPRCMDAGLVKKARAALRKARTAEQVRCAQAILMPSLLNCTLEQTAATLGVSRATVPRLQARFRASLAPGDPPPRRWGGRRRALMSVEQERRFLAPWLEQAMRGEMLVVSPLRAALVKELGRPVRASVVYRLLARHEWRKVAPDTRHPKGDPLVRQAWKKNSRRCWRIL